VNSKKDQFIANLSAVGFALPEIEAYLIRRKKKPEDPLNVYEARERGREYCQTNGSDHYILPGVEAMDLIISLGYAEHFCLASIIKYAARYGESGTPEELKKIADYAHILCGVRLAEDEGEGDAP
jgi:hypothetical protein